MITEIISVFSRKPVFGYVAFVFATIAIASLSMSVWAHHMFTTGAVSNPFFSIASFAIAVPTGIKFFNWIATMWRGHRPSRRRCSGRSGFLYLFLLGGITGIIVASPPLDYQLQDTYFVVAHFHNTLIGGSVFAIFAALYYWFPKMTGRRLSERLGTDPVRALGRRLHADVPAAVPARAAGDAAADRRLSGSDRLDGAQPRSRRSAPRSSGSA